MSQSLLIPAVIEHKFEVAKFSSFEPDNCYSGPTVPVVHNGVKLDFALCLRTNQSVEKDRIVAFVNYIDGPKQSIKLSYDLFVVKDSAEKPRELIGSVFDGREFNRGGHDKGTWGKNRALPRCERELGDKHFLTSGGARLHLIALLLIPESEFSDPELKYQVSPTRISNDFCRSLYSQITTPVDTTSSYKVNDRFELISSDEQRFYVHKSVLSFGSDVFKQMFDPNKPQDAQFSYIEQGWMKLEQTSAGALNQLLSYIYLGHATNELDTFVTDTIQCADMFGVHGLMLFCEQKLIQQMKETVNITDVINYLQLSDIHNFAALTVTVLETLTKCVVEQNETSVDVLLMILQLADEHKNQQLMAACENQLVLLIDPGLTVDGVLSYVSIARDYNLKHLLGECTKWLANKWPTLMVDGANDLISDRTGGLLTLVLGQALSAYANEDDTNTITS